MDAFKTEAVVGDNGSIQLQGLPISKGKIVEVIVLAPGAKPTLSLDDFGYPLAGTLIKYEDPTKPAVPIEDWNVYGDSP